MTISETDYFSVRSELLYALERIVALEEKYTKYLLEVTMSAASSIYEDFSQTMELRPFWENYQPVQRGRSPRGTSVPWGEVGEKTISACLIRAISLKNASITYPGLPLGGDIRFATSDALIHLDIKLTGPNDNPNEIVASPHQLSGDGYSWHDGVINSPVQIVGQKAIMGFQPELPPFYILGGQTLVCLTYFLKVVYEVQDLGIQPLRHLELICAPNGLLLFDGPQYAQTRGLLIPGKDIKEHLKKRARIRLDPLSSIADWRCIKIERVGTSWKSSQRFMPNL